MTFSEQVLSFTQDWLLPKLVDNVFHSNPFIFRVLGNSTPGKGESIKKPIKYQSSGLATSFSGLDTFTAPQLQTAVRMSYDMRGVRIPVGISGMSAVANAVSETQITDLVTNSVEQSEQELMDYLGKAIYGDGTGNSSKDPLGLAAIIDDGTSVATIGGLARGTYPVLDSTVTAATGGVLSLSKLATLYTNISDGSLMSTPTLIVSTPTVWDLYEQLLTPMVQEQYSQFGYYQLTNNIDKGAVRGGSHEGLVGEQGFVAVTYKGIPWVRDSNATAGNVFMLNEHWLQWYGWDAKGVFGYNKIGLGSKTIEGLYEEAPMDSAGFNWSGLRAPTNQFAGIADIILLGNFSSWQPRRSGRLTGVTKV